MPEPGNKTVQPVSRPATVRVFKAAKFADGAARRRISDQELCDAVAQLQASPKTYSLGGEVYKKRLNDNMDRSIVLAKGGIHWFYAHLFQKKTQDNITGKELDVFKEAAKVLGKLTGTELDAAVTAGKFVEICHDRESQEIEQSDRKRPQARKR